MEYNPGNTLSSPEGELKMVPSSTNIHPFHNEMPYLKRPQHLHTVGFQLFCDFAEATWNFGLGSFASYSQDRVRKPEQGRHEVAAIKFDDFSMTISQNSMTF